MVARDFISDAIPPVKPTDTVGYALDWMGEFKLSQLPIVDDGKFQGMITENDLLDASDLDASVAEVKYAGWDSAYVFETQHMFEVIKTMSALKLELLPVIQEDHRYLGVITQATLIRNLGEHFAIHEVGGIIVVEVAQNSYVLSEIGRIVESADAKVLSFSLALNPINNNLQITLKLNVEDLSRVVSTFERFQYQVVHTYQRNDNADDYRRNIDALMRFLDI